MPTPKDLPREMYGIWRVQYAPLERKVLDALSQKYKVKYKKMSYIKKIMVLDRIKAKGVYE